MAQGWLQGAAGARWWLAPACAGALAPAWAGLPFAVGQDVAGDDGLVWRALAALAVCLFAAVALVSWLKRRQRAGAAAQAVVERVASMRLSPRATLSVVRYRGRELLLCEDGGGVRLLGEHPAAAGQEAP